MKQLISIVILSLSSLIATSSETSPAPNTGTGCSWKLARHGKISSQITSTLNNRFHVRTASAARGWRNDKVPAEIERAQKDLAQLEENLIHDDRLDQAVHQTKRHIEAVEFAYVVIKNHLQPMREIFSSMIAELSAKKAAQLDDAEATKLEDAFRDVGSHYAETESYGRLSKERNAVATLRLLEEIFSAREGKPVDRAKVIQLLKNVEGFLKAKEAVYASEIGRHITTYEMLKSYLEANYEERHLAYAVRTENRDEHTLVSGLESTSGGRMSTRTTPEEETPTGPLTKKQIQEARKKTWEKNLTNLKARIGWEAQMRSRFPELGDVPSPRLEDIRAYYDQSVQARLTHNRRASIQELRITFLTQLIDITLIGAVVRPLVGHLLSGPGKLRRGLNALREWSQKAQKSIILKNIQELVETDESTIQKAANLAGYASDSRVGPYFLQLFASYADLNSRIVWDEIHKYTKQEDSYYKDLGKMMDKAQETADKDGIPVAIQTSYWSPSQTTAVVVWIIGFSYYQFYGDEDEELDTKVRNHFGMK
jgi:hypothetical protein